MIWKPLIFPPFTILIVPLIIIHCCSNFIHALEQLYPVSSNCPPGSNFTEGSSYEKYLDNLLHFLSSKANETTTNGGYFTTNTTALMGGPTTDNSEPIYGNFFCRGDVGPDICKSCVARVVVDARSSNNNCRDAKIATNWWSMCMVRYSNKSFVGELDEDTFAPLNNPKPVDGDAKQFLLLVVSTLNDLAQKVATSTEPIKYFATINGVPFNDLNLYTMAQCVPDIDPTMCKMCLNQCTNRVTVSVCNRSRGCQMYNPQCYLRFEIYSFEEVPTVSVPVSAPPLHPSGTTQPIAIAPAPVKKRFHPHAVSIALGVLAVIIVLLLAVLFYFLCTRMTRLKSTNVQDIELYPRPNNAASNRFDSPELTTESLLFDFKTLQNATNNFSDDNKLGEGGFGNVYKHTIPVKGYLQNGRQVAIKRLAKDSVQGAEQFKTEVLLVAKLQHRNLVRLLGYCLTSQEKLLVYEFVPRKSLDLILFDPNMQGQLDWFTRYKIIKGIARGILYLHEDSRLKIVHRDLKASNILLDVDMNPRISDFGLARNFDLNQKQDITNRLAGTLGYMAPEYMEYGEFSAESDVYSFGILVLEIISGRKISSRVINGTTENLMTFAWKHWDEDNPEEFVDSSLRDSYSRDEVMRCLHIGLLCVQRRIEDRPSMISVVLYLNSNQLVLPVPQQPVVFNGSQTGSRWGSRDHFSDRSIKTGSSTRETELQSSKSTSISSNSVSQKGSRPGSREHFSDTSIKTGPGSTETRPRSAKSTSKSANSVNPVRL